MTEFISTLADVSAIWLIILSFILCLIPLALVGGLVYGMYKLIGALPPIFVQGQEQMARIADGADEASRRVAAPFISASASASQVKGIIRDLGRIGRRKA